jgi:Xaa-Pro dipeptidase
MLKDLYADHVHALQERTEAVLETMGFDGLVIHSGTPLRYFADDWDAPFRATPHYLHWLPLEAPGNLLLIRAGKTPLLIHYSPEDFWYEQLPLGDPFWADSFEIKQVGKSEQVFEELPRNGKLAFHGDCPELAGENGFSADVINREELIARLDWNRAYKTSYEVACIEEATKQASVAHRAAKKAFESGATELEIHRKYVEALNCTEAQLPFQSIVALGDKGAFLHYDTKRTSGGGNVFLIDCGARYLSYASDITRTSTLPECDALFRQMVERFNTSQLALCSEVRPGLPFPELHQKAHINLGNLLAEVGILRVSAEDAVERGFTRPFFPHGLGHFLGIQVHDVGGHQKEPAGGTNPPPEKYPLLRTTRTLEESHVFTVEPGLYFIDMLLRDFREGDAKDAFDWSLIDRLAPCGGIRIEDNVVVTAAGHRNLTREHLP